MTIELIKILEAAKQYVKSSDCWFEQFQKTNSKADWRMSTEMSAKADAMLEAYKILTGRKVYQTNIDEELAMC